MNGICRDTNPGCAEVRPQDGLCTKCQDGFFLSGYKCIQNQARNDKCYIQDSEKKCYICKNGYQEKEGICNLPGVAVNNGLDSSFSSGSSTGTQTTTTTTSTNSNFDNNSNFGSSSFDSSFDNNQNTNTFTGGDLNGNGAFGGAGQTGI